MKNSIKTKHAWTAASKISGLCETRARPKPLPIWVERQRINLLSSLNRFDKTYMPFALFEDCNIGNIQRRQEAFYRNKEKKGVILPFIAAWALRGAAMGAGLSTACRIQVLGVDTALLQAGFGVALTLCVVFCAVMWIGWLGLTFFRE